MIDMKIVATDNPHTEVRAQDMFAHLPPMDPFEVKQDIIAANLAALIAFCGKTRSSIAEELGYHKSAVTRLLSGKNNTKIKTLWDVASHLGYDFEVIFHKEGEALSGVLQPWHQADYQHQEYQNITCPIVIDKQTAHEVARDFQSGRAKEFYYSPVVAHQNVTVYVDSSHSQAGEISLNISNAVSSATTAISCITNESNALDHFGLIAKLPEYKTYSQEK